MVGHYIAHDLHQILAGSESTSTVNNMTMLYVVTNPHVYQNLRTEIDTCIASGNTL